MTSRIIQKPADEERFREFRARRLEKKEADKIRLKTEFPLLFNNKAVASKVLGSSTNFNSKIPVTPSTASKRKSVIADKNNENSAFSANRSPKPIGLKTPLSGKKQRKGSLISTNTFIPQPVVVIEAPELVVPVERLSIPAAVVAMDTVIAPVFEVTEKIEPLEPAPVVQAEIKTESARNLAPSVVRKALFEDEELQQFTSTRSSISSLGESIVGDMDLMSASGECELSVQEQVLDALDYLLELDEVDEVTYRRMSSQAFSVKTLKRLSMNLLATPAAATSAATADMSPTPTEYQTCADYEQEQSEGSEQQQQQQSRRGSDVPMDLAYPESQEDCVIGELDVLNALRNYLAAANREAPVAEVAVEAAEQVAEAMDQVELAEEQPVELASNSVRSSASSMTTFDPRPQWSDTAGSRRGSLVPSSSRRTSLASISMESCCTTTMRVSFANSSAVSTSQKRKSAEAASAPESTVAEAAMAVAAKPAAKKSMVSHPLADLLDDALMRGLVVPAITERIEMGNHTKYIVQTQILSVPGYPEENSRVRMMALKRYSDFKTLRGALIEILEARRRVEMRTSLTPGKRYSLEGDDILALARSRRSSVESCYRESLLNPRDSLGTETVVLGALSATDLQQAGRESDLLPPLPSRQIMALSCASLQQEEDFQATREAFLRTWLETVFARQSCETEEYRTELRKFLSA